MMMQPFFTKFPEIAEKETRCIILPSGSNLAAGEYSFIESYCNKKDCDCRRVFINVLFKEEILATIGYGWESLQFYEKWIGEENLAIDVKGPVLELTELRTKNSELILKLFKEVMLNDKIFIERLKKHYEIFKKSL